jgi:hypothetical protein
MKKNDEPDQKTRLPLKSMTSKKYDEDLDQLLQV